MRERSAEIDLGSKVGVVLLLVLALAAIVGPLLAPHDPSVTYPGRVLEGPSRAFLLGTDNLGRCLLSRLIHGARWTLGTAVAAACLTVTVGAFIGGVSGYVGGWADTVLMRVVDVILAFPSLIPALVLVGILGAGMRHVLIGIVAVWWAGYARLIRSKVLSVKEERYVEAARALGFRESRVLARHVMPNVGPEVLVVASVDLGQLILAISALSFLGLGAQPPTPEWGAMIAEARTYLLTAPRLMLAPGLAISLSVVAFNLVGEGMRDLADSRLA